MVLQPQAHPAWLLSMVPMEVVSPIHAVVSCMLCNRSGIVSQVPGFCCSYPAGFIHNEKGGPYV